MSQRISAILTDAELQLACALLPGKSNRRLPSGAAELSSEMEAEQRDAAEKSLWEKEVIGANGELTSEWQLAVEILVAPQNWLSIGLADGSRVIGAQYFTAGGRLVACAKLPEGHYVSFPHQLADVHEAAVAWMQTSATWPSEPLLVELSTAELAAMAALADAMRESRLRAFLERRAPAADRFRRTLLREQIEQGVESRDPRWLAGILAVHAPFKLAELDLGQGLQQLAQREWISLADGEVVPHAPLTPICEDLGNTLPYLAIHSVSSNAGWLSMIALRGRTGFWGIEQAGDAQEFCRFTTLSGQQLSDGLAQQLGLLLETNRGV